jgi:hypothetical protein
MDADARKQDLIIRPYVKNLCHECFTKRKIKLTNTAQ